MGIFGQIQTPVRQILKQLMADKDLRKEINYRKYTGRAWSDEAGGQVDTFEVTEINAIRLSHTAQSKILGIGNVQGGDQLYLFDFRDAPSGMSLKDEILDENSEIQKLKNITPIFGLAVAVTIEGGSSGV